MTCLKPYYVNGFGYVPCGQCKVCRKARTREWALRIMHEVSYWDKSSFITLTYDDAHLPKDNSLSIREFQLWMKRFRKELEGRKVKYYACGEYGDKYGRPHYHSIVFGVSQEDKALIDSTWLKGFSKVGSVTMKSAQYVAGYVQKKFNGDLKKEVYGDREGPFQLCSRGIGERWLLDNEKYVIDNSGVTLFGIGYTIPRYYMKKLDGKLDKYVMEQKKILKVSERLELLRKRGIDELSEAEYGDAQRKQRKEELLTKESLFRKGVL